MTTYEGVDNLALTHIAEGVIPVLVSEEQHATAELVAELAGRVNNLDAALVERDLHAELAQEGIGQTPPIALVLSGTDEYGAERRAAVLDAVEQLQLEGYVVLQHSFDAGLDDEDKNMMGSLLRHKIDMADVVNVMNEDEDVYDVVLPFIEYAREAGTPVQYLIDPDQ